MDKEFVKRNTEAHGWLGLIISGLLFVVFFTGSISFFRDEIQLWATSAYVQTQSTQSESNLALSEVMELAIAGRAFNAKEHLVIYPPTEHEPYYTAYVDIIGNEGSDDYVGLIMDPVTGDVVGNPDSFFLADFLYILHYSLNLPFGMYIIGFVALFFLFSIFSGVLIHASDMVKGFFRYRADGRKRSQLLDLHNIIGVVSLPYTLMLAITGLIFNLVIIYQIAFGVILYEGDIDALLVDAGFVTVEPQWQDQPWSNPPIDELYEQQIQRWDSIPSQIRVYNYGDESAVLEFYGPMGNEFAGQYGIAYNLSDRSVVFAQTPDNPNAVTNGLDVVATLHFGAFGGLDLRFVYFLLGLAVCGLIVTGNLLWVGQREKKLSSAKIAFVARFTLASTAGVAVATSFAFLAERLLPLGEYDRAGSLSSVFVLSLLLASGYIWLGSNRRKILIRLLQIVCAVCSILVLLDTTFFSDGIVAIFKQGHMAPLGVDIGLFLSALLSGYISYKLQSRLSVSVPEKYSSHDSVPVKV
ncbi:MAG: peptidase [SAR86 cluster bacterium]|uniref:Peptidase n=1 Tax=SAR86 cluster bacterium TaxID=2030880 RepID=A0A2A5B8S8_9GAMM|nr:MAG: peptidase [SAR86 cluster bacterium]